MNKINVAIVDDNERMLTLLENILNEDSDISVIGKGGDGLQALDLIHKKNRMWFFWTLLCRSWTVLR